MKHFDLFSGYGGFALALERVYGTRHLGISRTKEGSVQKEDEELVPLFSVENGVGGQQHALHHTIGFSEIDKYASAVLKYHWPNTKNYGDITKINWSEVPDFDLLTGGSPCQDLSVAGRRSGLEGARSGLFYEFMRAVQEKKPRYFIWENVKGALSSNKGFDFGAVINEMAEAGYSLWWQVLNAKDFGVPQNRERIFVIGFRDGSPREVLFEAGQGGQNTTIGESTETTVARTLTGGGHSGGNHSGMTILRQPLKFLERNQKNIEGDYAYTVDTANTGGVKIDSRIRRLTPIECERLMGLPDGWTLGDGTISDSQRYKMCGNGVVVNVVEELLREIINKS